MGGSRTEQEAIPPAFTAVLDLILDRLEGLGHPWALTGSLSIALRGMPLVPRDIDLQSDRAGAVAMAARMSAYQVEQVQLRESEQIRSYIGHLEMEGLKVEIMGDVQKRGPAGWDPAPDLSRWIETIPFRGRQLPVLSLGYEAEAYQRMGRARRAAQIRAHARLSRPQGF